MVYAFVVRDCVTYIGSCDSSATGLADRMSRYQSLVGAGTNARLVGLIGSELSKGDTVLINALKPPAGHGISVWMWITSKASKRR